MNTLVLGIGNLLLQDEGAGVRAVEEFGKKYRVPAEVELLDGGTSGMDLLQYIQGRDNLIIVDVVKSGNPSGTIIRLEGEEVPALLQKKISPHQLGLSDLLAVAQLTGLMPSRVVLLGIEPEATETGLDLSEEVGRNIGKLADMVALELVALGLVVPTQIALPIEDQNACRYFCSQGMGSVIT